MLFGAAFTKNEGIVFAIALLGAVAQLWRAAIVPVLCGALPGLVITAWFKLFYAPSRNTCAGLLIPGA
jgi:hypothetical protein